MSLFKRISTTLHARLDSVVNQLENHDAVVEAALREGRKAAARAKVRLARVRKDGERLTTSLEEARRAEGEWRARAQASAEDEGRALECLRRRRVQAKRVEELEHALAAHHEGEARLAKDVAAAERRLAEINDQRNLMRSREATADALGALASAEHNGSIDLDDALERWEVRLTEAELTTTTGADASDPADPLERHYLHEEEDASLRDELRALRGDEKEG